MIQKKKNKFFKRPETSSPGLLLFSSSLSLSLSLSLSGERKAFSREKKGEEYARSKSVSARTVWSFLSVSF